MSRELFSFLRVASLPLSHCLFIFISVETEAPLHHPVGQWRHDEISSSLNTSIYHATQDTRVSSCSSSFCSLSVSVCLLRCYRASVDTVCPLYFTRCPFNLKEQPSLSLHSCNRCHLILRFDCCLYNCIHWRSSLSLSLSMYRSRVRERSTVSKFTRLSLSLSFLLYSSCSSSHCTSMCSSSST